MWTFTKLIPNRMMPCILLVRINHTEIHIGLEVDKLLIKTSTKYSQTPQTSNDLKIYGYGSNT